MYTLANGTTVCNAWIEEKGKYYYVDFTGCLMMNNYTADGFYVKDDGSWDKSVKQRKDESEQKSDDYRLYRTHGGVLRPSGTDVPRDNRGGSDSQTSTQTDVDVVYRPDDGYGSQGFDTET